MSARRASDSLGALLILAIVLGGCGSSSTTVLHTVGAASTPVPSPSTTSSTTSSTAGVVTASAHGVTATLHAGTHDPKVERPWPIHFTVTRGGSAARATLEYEYLFGGQVVAHRSHYKFTRHFSDIFKWPSSAVGYPLTFRAVIVSEGVTLNLDYPVQVAK